MRQFHDGHIQIRLVVAVDFAAAISRCIRPRIRSKVLLTVLGFCRKTILNWVKGTLQGDRRIDLG